MAYTFEPRMRTCPKCGAAFNQDAAWKTVCFPCYKAAHPERYPNRANPYAQTAQPEPGQNYRDKALQLQREVNDLHLQVALLRCQLSVARPSPQQPPFDAEMLRRLIRLCHPDLHNGSEPATIATKYLLSLRVK
jgi:hypothetical protein